MILLHIKKALKKLANTIFSFMFQIFLGVQKIDGGVANLKLTHFQKIFS